jgi:hypothetical protein
MGKLIYDGVVYAGGVVVYSALSTTSTNPVQNKVVAEAVNTINTHLSNKADKVWTIAGGTGTVGGAVTVPTTGVSELLIAGALNINGQAEISGSVIIPMHFLAQDRNFRIQLGYHSEIGQMQVSYIKNNGAFYITDEYYSIGTIAARAMVVYYR